MDEVKKAKAKPDVHQNPADTATYRTERSEGSPPQEPPEGRRKQKGGPKGFPPGNYRLSSKNQ
ncbi:hypothetical protein GGTG_04887 [Gaeumannomyces tritici R3-111a-1]|uniref:Uncharacterized protein n=1 Tax=Gaeumannomyces tritici (strain R3-111a-1) TaxID=644352 RepID=J3NUD1_GAET3|nr:hypothetical protein GGTG_04887 [Gaeumannomyces tritici R3-111a-1]EJT79804.1 hypothetical protein GGTG_04887 [Gaeumannomyces tritici R3-111a-1]